MKSTPRHNIGWQTIAAPLALLFIGLIIYSNTFHSPFQFDDYGSIVGNPSFRGALDLRAIWAYWPSRFVTYLSLALNYRFHQLDVFGYHVFNLAVHIGGALLLWWLTLMTFSSPSMKGQKITSFRHTISFFTGLIFVAHPVQTQGVTYIIQRAVSLAAFFYLASLSLYVRSRLSECEGKGPGSGGLWYLGSLATAVLALLTKEMSVTLPLAVCLYEFSFFRTDQRFRWGRVLPFFFVLLVLVGIFWAMLKSGAITPAEVQRLRGGRFDFSAAQYSLTQLRVILTYARLLLVPLRQNVDYDYPIANSLFEWPVVAGLSFVAGGFFAAFRLFRGCRLVSFGIFLFFLTLLPESSVIPIKDVIFEHRLYLPMAGFSIILVAGLCHLFGRGRLRAAVIILVGFSSFFSVLTYSRNAVWRGVFTLWDDTIRKSPRKARPYLGRGTAHARNGDFDKAIADFKKAIENKPDYAESYSNLGFAYEKKWSFDEALESCTRAIEIDPEYVDAYFNRAVVYAKKGDLDRAIADYSKILELDPGYADAYFNRACAYRSKGDFGLADADSKKAVAIDPRLVVPGQEVAAGNKSADASAYNERGSAYARSGDFDRAIIEFSRALEIDPRLVSAYKNRGGAYALKGDFSRALSDLNKAIAIDPFCAEAYNNRAGAYFEQHDYARALEDARKAQSLGFYVPPDFLRRIEQLSVEEK